MHLGKRSLDNFIREHHYIQYCEAIIYPDGEIEYANPSHVEALLRITGENRKVIDDKMPITASPIFWLIQYTKCVALWYDGYIQTELITEEQKATIQKLQKHKIIKIEWNRVLRKDEW